MYNPTLYVPQEWNKSDLLSNSTLYVRKSIKMKYMYEKGSSSRKNYSKADREAIHAGCRKVVRMPFLLPSFPCANIRPPSASSTAE